MGAALATSDFTSKLQDWKSRFVGIACILDKTNSVTCSLGFSSKLKVKDTYSVPYPVWPLTSATPWSPTICSKIMCATNANRGGCPVAPTPTSSQWSAAFSNWNSCVYDENGAIPSCTAWAPGGVKKTDGTCTQCTTYSTTESKCTACGSGYLVNGLCAEACPTGTTGDSATKTCAQSCPSDCAQWETVGGVPKCITCTQATCVLQWTTSKPYAMYISTTAGQCIASCPAFTALVPTKPVIMSSSSYYFPLWYSWGSQLWSSCSINPSITSLADPLVLCGACNANAGTAMYAKVDTWVSSCGTDNYISNGACKPWSAGTMVFDNPSLCEDWGNKCASGFCTSSSNRPLCTKCMDGSVLQEGKWIAACTSDFKFYSSSSQAGIKQCLKTWPSSASYSLPDGQWVSSCPSTFVSADSNKKCLTCAEAFPGWETCVNVFDKSTSANVVKCRKCSSTKPYFNSAYTAWIDSWTSNQVTITKDSFKFWVDCPDGCSSCSLEGTKVKCSACSTGYIYDEADGICSKKCKLGRFEHNGKCLKEWPTGYSSQLSTWTCQLCPINGCTSWISIGTYVTCDKCASNLRKTGNLLSGYKCESAWDLTDANYWMKNGQCTKVTGFKDSSGQCQNWPDNCETCILNSSGQPECTKCSGIFWLNSEKKCDLAIFTDKKIMQVVDASNKMSFECKASWDAGYTSSIFNTWFKCDVAKYPQCSDTNCNGWDISTSIPIWAKCNSGYMQDPKNNFVWT